MGNFDFVQGVWPGIHEDAARAESNLTADPRVAIIYSRRTVELLVRHLYEVLDLDEPYLSDLAALINDGAFKTRTGIPINSKLNYLRKAGNNAVHKTTPVTQHDSLGVLRELFHVLVWAVLHHSTAPDTVPTGAQFDPAPAAQTAPLSKTDVQKLAAKFKEQDENYRTAIAERSAEYEAEIAKLREQIKAVQAASTKTDDHDYSEQDTRDLFIDLLLREAGWPLTDPLDREYEVSGMPNNAGVGFIDYVLWGANGLPLAVVEAKRTTKSVHAGQQQAKLYADALEAQFGRRPVIYTTNGYQHWLWDDASGYPQREVQGFHTRDELELMVQRRTTREALAGQPINSAIVERPYQHHAIKAVGEAFDGRQREALLVMATGSGKTRTVIALIEQLMKAGWVKRALFLADRVALVNQAVGAFKAHLPQATAVNLVTEKNSDGRVYVSTYPTMLGLINSGLISEMDAASNRRFGPGYFDLIVIDEAHRSVYAKYGAIFEYFDSLLVGLTATPKDEVDHNTYRLFHLEDGVPTDAYSLEQAVADGYLVPPRAVSVGTRFLRQGIRYADLSEEEKDQWDALEWGDDGPPDEVGAEELNRFLFNEDTVDKVLATLMTDGLKVAGGDRLGKTIIFAKNQQHAEFIAERFNFGWPKLEGGHFARVITHNVSYAQSLIDDFSNPAKAPHIAISVDMLDTGIDVPEVVNLVFFKAVRSKTKFWQMIGRGTRLAPDLYGPGQHKTGFLVFDFCGNLEYFSQNLPGSEGSLQKSLTQRLFEARVGLVTALGAGDPLRASTAALLREFVAGMTLDNVLVRPHRRAAERLAAAEPWQHLSHEDAELALTLSGLPSSEIDPDEAAKRFDLLVLRRQLAQLEGDAVTAERLRETVQTIAQNLLGKLSIPSVKEQAELLDAVAGDDWWVDVTLPMLELLRPRVRGLVRFVDKTKHAIVYTDLEDTLGDATEITLPGTTPGFDLERFKAKASAYLRAHENDVALQRLTRDKQLTAQDLDSLQRMLEEAGADAIAVERIADGAGGLGLFIRSLVGLDRAAAQEAFAGFIVGRTLTAAQLHFIDLVIGELTSNGVMKPGRLFESPYTDKALFSDAEVTELAQILKAVEARATVA